MSINCDISQSSIWRLQTSFIQTTKNSSFVIINDGETQQILTLKRQNQKLFYIWQMKRFNEMFVS